MGSNGSEDVTKLQDKWERLDPGARRGMGRVGGPEIHQKRNVKTWMREVVPETGTSMGTREFSSVVNLFLSFGINPFMECRGQALP